MWFLQRVLLATLTGYFSARASFHFNGTRASGGFEHRDHLGVKMAPNRFEPVHGRTESRMDLATYTIRSHSIG